MCLAVVPVASAVGMVALGLLEIVEIVAVMVVDAMVPSGMNPLNGGEKVSSDFENGVLPIVENVAQVDVSVVPIDACAIVR